jgi:hypothetical protein
MSLNRVRVIVMSLGGLAVCGLGCGGSGKATDPLALCSQACEKEVPLCAPGATAAVTAQAVTLCKASCPTTVAGGTSCTNLAAIVAAYQACLDKTTCADLTDCAGTIPACVGGGGSGGTHGGGGVGGAGTGGTTGGGSGGASAGAAGAPGAGGAATSGSGGNTGVGGTGLFGFDAGISGFDALPGLDAFAGTCADLLACCNSIADATKKAQCQAGYALVQSSGDTACGVAYTGLKQDGYCQ